MGLTRRRDLAVTVLGAALLSYPAVALLYRWFPPITIWTGLSLAAVAVAEAAWAQHVRAKVGAGEVGLGRGRLHPLTAALCVPVAKASAWMGALVLGFWLAVLGYLLSRRSSLRVAEQDTPGAVIAAVCALAVLVAALWLQHCCTLPPDPAGSGDAGGSQPG